MQLLVRNSSSNSNSNRRRKCVLLMILTLTIIFWFLSLVQVSQQIPNGEVSYALNDLDVYDIDEADYISDDDDDDDDNNNNNKSVVEEEFDWKSTSLEENERKRPYLRKFVYDEDDLFVSRENHKRIREKDSFSANENTVNRVLPETSPEIRHKSCALVGNSGILKRTVFGKSIDKHEAVMRVNQAPVKGYEKFVGSKITYRMLNNKWTTVYYEDGVANTDVPGGTSNLARYLLAQEPSNVTFIVSRATTKQFETFSQTIGKRRIEMPRPLLLSSRVVSGARTALIAFRDFEKENNKNVNYSEEELTPSTGLLGVYLLLNLCKKVSVYGFSLDDSRKTNDMKAEGLRYHYFKKYADSERLLAHPHHNFKMEGDILKALADANIIELCTKERDSEATSDC